MLAQSDNLLAQGPLYWLAALIALLVVVLLLTLLFGFLKLMGAFRGGRSRLAELAEDIHFGLRALSKGRDATEGPKDDIRALLVEVSKLRKVLEKAQAGAEDAPKPRIENYELESSATVEVTSSDETPMEDKLVELLERINAATQSAADDDRFWQLYRPTRIAVVNSSQRAADPYQPARFETAKNGDYYAVALEDASPNQWYVVPRPRLVVEDLNYRSGAIGEVFECRGHKPTTQHKVSQVRRPAVFERLDGTSWKLIGRGLLDLDSQGR
jgi:hypothetical protein